MPVMTNDIYLKKFRSLVKVLESLGVRIGNHPELIEAELGRILLTIDTVSARQLKTAKQTVREKNLGIQLILNSDKTRFGKLIEDLANDHLFG